MSLNPFMPSTHGHPNFNPTKSVANSKNFQFEMNRAPKHLKPEKPLIPYMRYSKKVWDEVKAQYPDLKVWDISKIVGQMWRVLDESEKQKYIEEFEAEKNEYNESLKQYHQSPAYQSFINSLKMKESEDRESVHKRRDKKSNNQAVGNSPQRSENRYSLQQAMEADENDEYFSAKHLAAARYYRNNKLVNDIFTDEIVPENRNAFDMKVQLLRKQVDSLTVYQKKMVEELQQIEEKFQQKKHALLESSERFQSEMNKRFAPNSLHTAIKDHYQRTLLKTMEMMKNEHANKMALPISTSSTSAGNSNPNKHDDSLSNMLSNGMSSTSSTPNANNLHIINGDSTSQDSTKSS